MSFGLIFGWILPQAESLLEDERPLRSEGPERSNPLHRVRNRRREDELLTLDKGPQQILVVLNADLKHRLKSRLSPGIWTVDLD